MPGAEDCTPPTGCVGGDRAAAVREERQNTGASAESATTPDGRVPRRAPTGWEGRRPRRPQQHRAHRTAPLPAGFGPPNCSIVEDGDSPGRPKLPHVRAQRTLPLPQGRLGGTASSRSGKIAGAEDCAPPGHRSTVGILRHWPAREGPRPRGPLECACSLPVASRWAGHPACCSGKKATGCFSGHQPLP
jgi:hypothetical protein